MGNVPRVVVQAVRMFILPSKPVEIEQLTNQNMPRFKEISEIDRISIPLRNHIVLS